MNSFELQGFVEAEHKDIDPIPPQQLSKDLMFNICDYCQIAMLFNDTLNNYQCENCGLVKQVVGEMRDLNENSRRGISIKNGRYESHVFSMHADSSKQQYIAIFKQLTTLNETAPHPIAIDILVDVATIYNNIRKNLPLAIVDPISMGNKRSFVKRGNIKDEILAALLEKVCNNKDAPRKPQEITVFMNLANGYSHGKDILNTLVAERIIELPLDKEPSHALCKRYLNCLGVGIEGQSSVDPNVCSNKYVDAVLDIVEEANNRNIGMTSINSSKIAGVINLICQYLSNYEIIKPIPHILIEKACDNIRKNTFQSYGKLIDDNLQLFAHIFDRYGIPNRLMGRVRRVDT